MQNMADETDSRDCMLLLAAKLPRSTASSTLECPTCVHGQGCAHVVLGHTRLGVCLRLHRGERGREAGVKGVGGGK